MTVREYLKNFDEYTKVTFIKARARKNAHAPGYHAEYQTTPIRTIKEWAGTSRIMDYYILNHKQAPIDWLSGAPWNNDFEAGRLLSLLVISEEDLETMYPTQGEGLITYIEKKILEN